jgi:hypothetical protein
VSHNPSTRVSPRARPVAEAPIDALLARADELARRWLIALILARPLAQLGELPLERMAREGPELCIQAVRALASDAALERIVASTAGDGESSAWARELGLLGGARDARSSVEAVEALRGELWEALLEELRDPPARLVAELADRLAHVCATALAAAVAATSRADLGAADLAGVASESDLPPIGLQGGVLIDERDELVADPDPANDPRAPAGPDAQRTQAHPLPWELSASPPDEPGPSSEVRVRRFPADLARATADVSELEHWPDAAPARESRPQTGPGAGPEIEIRDERGEEGPAAWIGSIGRQLERFEQDRRPFAVLLIELGGGVEPLRRAALPGGISVLTSQVERVLAQELQLDGGASEVGRDRPVGSLTCERPGRYWLLVADTDATAARRLAEWLVRAVHPLATRRWPPLEVTVGTAVCPDDGREAATLAARADVGLYAARAAGRSIASVDEPA